MISKQNIKIAPLNRDAKNQMVANVSGDIIGKLKLSNVHNSYVNDHLSFIVRTSLLPSLTIAIMQQETVAKISVLFLLISVLVAGSFSI